MERRGQWSPMAGRESCQAMTPLDPNHHANPKQDPSDQNSTFECDTCLSAELFGLNVVGGVDCVCVGVVFGLHDHTAYRM